MYIGTTWVWMDNLKVGAGAMCLSRSCSSTDIDELTCDANSRKRLVMILAIPASPLSQLLQVASSRSTSECLMRVECSPLLHKPCSSLSIRACPSHGPARRESLSAALVSVGSGAKLRWHCALRFLLNLNLLHHHDLITDTPTLQKPYSLQKMTVAMQCSVGGSVGDVPSSLWARRAGRTAASG